MGLLSIRLGNWVSIAYDLVTGALVLIDYAHHETHAGNHYFIRGGATMADEEVIDFIFETPDSDERIHITRRFDSAGPVVYSLYEDTDADADGTIVTAFNSRRDSTNTSGVVLRENPTINSVGTLLYTYQLGSGVDIKTFIAGTDDRSNEFILKPNTKYLVRLVSGAATNVANWDFEFYMHADRN